MSPSFLIFGYGYTAKIFSTELITQGYKVVGTTRSFDLGPEQNWGIELIDFDCPNMEEFIRQSTHILICIPPRVDKGDIVLEKFGELIKKQRDQIQWIGYLSSTGVYGDHKGEWVDEKTACSPHTLTGITRLKAEQSWLSYAINNQLPLHIFRISGIYGPGRNALERLLHGKKYRIFKKEQVFCRIHVEDLVSVLLASIRFPSPLSIYNISDDEPAASHVVDSYAAFLLHKDPLPLVDVANASLSAMEQEFYSNNRRVSNLKIKEELQVILKYPSFREGLTQIYVSAFQH